MPNNKKKKKKPKSTKGTSDSCENITLQVKSQDITRNILLYRYVRPLLIVAHFLLV